MFPFGSVIPSQQEEAWLSGASGTFSLRKGDGCSACRKTGYRGRLGIFELMNVDETVRQLIQTCATASQITASASVAGMRTLRDDGVHKVCRGITTIEEVERVTMRAAAVAGAEVDLAEGV
jgi:type II secretory ATPase GspE/PulE/Tfp pilus assembly ATPase PilB-like protein